jgi:hypothetical protein
MEFTEKQLERLVEDVKGQLSQLLKGEAEEKKDALAKSEVPAPAPEKVEEKPLEKKEESSSEAKKAEESSSELEKSGLPAAPHTPKDRGPTAKAEDSESKTEESKESSSSADMEKAYKEMSKSERETHYKALKRFIWEDQGFEIKKAEECSKACKAEESSDSAKKAEEESSTESAEKAEASMSKAEEELVAVKVENDALKKNVEQLIASLEKVIVKGPDRKSVANIGEVVLPPTGGTSETVAEPVLKSKLNDLTRSDKLTKAERDLINDYCLFGKGRADILSIVKDKSK